MNIIKDNFRKYILYILLSMVTAAGNMGIVYLINNIINSFIAEKPVQTYTYLGYFSVSLLVFFVTRWIVAFNIIGFTQKILRKVRMDILQMVLKSPYPSMMKNKERIYTAMTRDSTNIVQASINVVDIVTNTIIVVICFVYMSFLSWKMLLAMIGLLFFTVFLYTYSEKKRHALFNKAMVHDERFIKYLGEILAGFKEIVIDRKKGTDISNKRIIHSIDAAVSLNQKALVSHLNNRVIGQMAFYVFIGSTLLFLGNALSVEKKVLVNFIFLVLYVFGPIETIVLLIPGLSQARTSLKRLSLLKADLLAGHVDDVEITAATGFRKLSAKHLYYKYETTADSESPFSVGPLNFELKKGEVIFIFGGNGSGKTTFINLLIGLFPFHEGDMYLDEEKVESTQSYAYRSLFAPVFSDFHLFDECYGGDHMDPGKARQYLALFELEEKVAILENGFTTIDLSTGQRKRLALICAMLEKKPVLVLDEFAADQDPYFRRKFYLEILPFLRAEGFTVIAITHDDHYYAYCDAIYKMDTGKLSFVRANDLSRDVLHITPVVTT